MKMGQKIKLALIGCGKIAGERKHIDAICKNSSLTELAYTCDKVIERAREKAEAYKRGIKEEISRFAQNDKEKGSDKRRYKLWRINHLLYLLAF